MTGSPRSDLTGIGRAIAQAVVSLGGRDEEVLSIETNGGLRQRIAELVRAETQKVVARPVVTVSDGGNGDGHHHQDIEMEAAWRRLASSSNYHGRVRWVADDGGTFWWIPRVLSGSTSKSVADQMEVMAEMRVRFGLPAHHLISFGSRAVLAWLVMALQQVHPDEGRLVSRQLDNIAVRTDTLQDGFRVVFGLNSHQDFIHWSDQLEHPLLGAFPIGVD